MHSAILRALVFLSATGVIAAATHANVMHAGGYGSRDAPLIITLAILLALGMTFVGVCFSEGGALAGGPARGPHSRWRSLLGADQC